jgi:hypothetical protein
MDHSIRQLLKLEEQLDTILYEDVGVDTPLGKKLSQLQADLSKIITTLKGW